jgi:membrane-bound lytic murein transglycosylase A
MLVTRQKIVKYTLLISLLPLSGQGEVAPTDGGKALLLAENVPLQQLEDNCQLGVDDRLWDNADRQGDRKALLTAIDNSLRYLNTTKAEEAYRNYRRSDVTRDRVVLSLKRFRELLLKSQTPEELQAAVEKEFVFDRLLEEEAENKTHFTGYFEPVYSASRTPNAEYRYPLYRKPANFESWTQPHPTRKELEGENGLLGQKSPLAGRELVWLRDRFEAFLIHVQGSARLELTDGSTMSVGYDSSTSYAYKSIGKELVKDGKVPEEGLTLTMVAQYFQDHPEELDEYLPRNDRFIFFRETNGQPPIGSLGVPVTADRSIATDKNLMPHGALALIRAPIPDSKLKTSLVTRYVLNQDTGAAIKGASRVDIFMGSGKLAGDRAGLINGDGELYYLLLK